MTLTQNTDAARTHVRESMHTLAAQQKLVNKHGRLPVDSSHFCLTTQGHVYPSLSSK